MSSPARVLPLASLLLGACVIPANNPPVSQPGIAPPPPEQRPQVVDHRDDQPVIAGDDSLLDFGEWDLYDNGATHPTVRGGELELIPDDVYSAAAAAFWRGEARGPYVLELDYRTWDDDGGPLDNSADGIAVMILKSDDAYRRTEPPAGGARGVINDGTGYAVHVRTYGSREVFLTDGAGRVLARRPWQSTYTHDRFSRLRVEVGARSIDVSLDGVETLRWTGALDDRFGGIAIAAGTGAVDSQHVVRDVRLTRGGGGENLIVNGDFEQTQIGSGGWQILPSLPGWSVVSGRGIEVQNNVAGSPARGEHHVELDGDEPVAIAQEIDVEPGRGYELRYQFAARPGTAAADNRLEVYWNGALVDVVQAAGDRPDTLWIERTVQLPAVAGRRADLEFRDTGAANGLGTYLDAVELTERY